MDLRRKNIQIAYETGLNPFELDDDEYCQIWNGLQWLLGKKQGSLEEKRLK